MTWGMRFSGAARHGTYSWLPWEGTEGTKERNRNYFPSGGRKDEEMEGKRAEKRWKIWSQGDIFRDQLSDPLLSRYRSVCLQGTDQVNKMLWNAVIAFLLFWKTNKWLQFVLWCAERLQSKVLWTGMFANMCRMPQPNLNKQQSAQILAKLRKSHIFHIWERSVFLGYCFLMVLSLFSL